MKNEQIIAAFRAHDWGLLTRVDQSSPDLADEVERVLPQLDDEARQLAVMYLIRYDGPRVGSLLLKMTADGNAQVSAEAVRGVLKVKDPPLPGAVLAQLHQQPDEYLRGYLYLALGKLGDVTRLEPLRALAKNEADPAAALDAQAAAVKLGGRTERRAFLERVRGADPDTAERASEHLLYIGDPQLARGLLPWLANEKGVLQIGSDRQGRMARMCDLAAWTAFQLGVKFPLRPEHLDNYDEQVIKAATRAIQALPAERP